MRLSFFIAFISTCLLAVGCSHKQKEAAQESAPSVAKQEEIKKEEKSIAKDNTYICDVLGDKRVVLLDKESKRCEVHYTKFGESNQVAWAEATPSLCGEVFERIRTNIESRGFKCQAASDAKDSKDTKLEAKRETAATTK